MDYKEKYKNALERAKVIYQGSYKPDTAATIAEILQSVFPELIESKDERIKGAIIEHLRDNNLTEWASWLEKQGQKDPCEDCKHPMLNCHNFPCSKKQKYQGKSALEAAKEEKVDNINKIEVKPKFKVGDWVVDEDDNSINQVERITENVTSGKISYDLVGGGYFPSTKKNYHLWTVADAKDGDVLDANGAPFIYKKHDKDYVYFYCGVNLAGEFIEANGIDTWNNNSKVYPATKEQRELLFSKMKEAGYEWDSEKKELRKIEQKLAEKVEPRFKVGDWITNGDYTWKVVEVKPLDYILQSQDGSTVDDTISYVDGQFHRYCSFCEDVEIEIPFGAKDSELMEATYFIPEGFHAEIEDGKVIIKKGEQKSSWSKEDKRIMSAISQLLKDCESENGWNCVYSNDREVFFVDIEKWLQSLKQIYIWKPTKE